MEKGDSSQQIITNCSANVVASLPLGEDGKNIGEGGDSTTLVLQVRDFLTDNLHYYHLPAKFFSTLNGGYRDSRTSSDFWVIFIDPRPWL